MKRLWKNRGGFTLVEIIVTFTLTAIFMTSAAMVLSTFMRSHTVASAVATEQDVAAIVMNTVTSSLSAAKYNTGIFTEAAKPEGETLPADVEAGHSLLLLDDGKTVWYVDGESENVVKMYRGEDEDGNGYLAMDYFVRPEAGAAPGAVWAKVPWKLGQGVYQNCSLKDFTVSRMGEDNSCLNVTLVIENKLAGDSHTFAMKRTVECYNLAADNIKKVS